LSLIEQTVKLCVKKIEGRSSSDMHWPEPPYPPGFQPPGIGFFLLIGGVVFCFLGIVICMTIKCALAQCGSQQSPDQPPPKDEQELP
jgi:hypothetical protein